jgi:diguanylate cyclase (GGDEF)-like protein
VSFEPTPDLSAEPPDNPPVVRRDWLGAEVLRWQAKYRLAVAAVGAAAAVAGAALGAPGVGWADATAGGAAALLYAAGALYGARRAVVRRHAGGPLRVLAALGDVALVFALTVALAGPAHYERALVLSTFSVLVSQLYLGPQAARAALGAGVVGYAVLLAWATRRASGVDVWGGVGDLVLFGCGGLVVALAHASRQRRLGDLVGLFGRLEEGDFGRAHDWTRDPRPDEVTAVGRAYDRMRTQVADAVLTDPLSGCVNRRGFDQQLARELARAERAGAPVALIAVDVDHFKRVNDQHGHAAGDAVIRDVGALLREGARAGDVVARVGGEEFVLVLPDADEEGAAALARRLVDAARARQFAAVPGLAVTVSAGVAAEASVRDAALAEALKTRADAALYAAKRGGRDRAVVWAPHGMRRVDTPPAGVAAVGAGLVQLGGAPHASGVRPLGR